MNETPNWWLHTEGIVKIVKIGAERCIFSPDFFMLLQSLVTGSYKIKSLLAATSTLQYLSQ